MKTHALTIDLEDWHQLVHRHVTGELIRPNPAVVADTHRLLDLLDDAKAKATFFVLGYVAEAYPDLVREIARRGHEVGSHTYSHQLIDRMEPAAFKADLERSLKQLQDLLGQSVWGFRAPEFSVGHLRHWSFEILVELGFRYDSSVFPVAGPRYGIPESPRHAFPIDTPSGRLWEYPLTTWDVGRWRIPVAGGTYFRLLTKKLLLQALDAADRERRTAVLYFHPYEFHQGWLWLSHERWFHHLQWKNLKPTMLYNFCTGLIVRRLQYLLTRFRFVSLGEIHRDEYTTLRQGA